MCIQAQYLDSKYHSYFKKEKSYDKFLKAIPKKTNELHKKGDGQSYLIIDGDYYSEFFIPNQYKEYTKNLVKDKKALLEPVYKLRATWEKEIVVSPDWDATRKLYDSLKETFNLVPFNVIQEYERHFQTKRKNHWQPMVKAHQDWYREYMELTYSNRDSATVKQSIQISKMALKDPVKEYPKTGEFYFHNSEFYDAVLGKLSGSNSEIDYIISPSIRILQQVITNNMRYYFSPEIDSEIQRQAMRKYNIEEPEDSAASKEYNDAMTKKWSNMMFSELSQAQLFYHGLTDQNTLDFYSIEVFKNLKQSGRDLGDLALLSAKTIKTNSEYKAVIKSDIDCRGLSFGEGMKSTGEGYKMAFKSMGSGFKGAFNDILGKESGEDTVNKNLEKQKKEWEEENQKIESQARAYYDKVNRLSQEKDKTQKILDTNISFLKQVLTDLKITSGIKSQGLN